MQTLILNHYPPVIKQIREMQQIAKAEDIEFSKLNVSIRKVIRNMFAFTADESGISRFEKILGIPAKTAQTLDERRLYVIYAMNRRKMSLSELMVILSGYSQEIDLRVNYNTNELSVIVGNSVSNVGILYKILDDFMPLHVYIFFAMEDIVSLTEFLEVPAEAEMETKIKWKYNVQGAWYLDGSAFLDGSRMLNADVWQQKLTIDLETTIKTMQGFQNVELISHRNLWYLDGTMYLNGDRKLNAELYKGEIIKMSTAVTTRIAKKKMLLARAGVSALPKIAMMAFGDGGVNTDGEVIDPEEEQTELKNEIYRKDITKYEIVSDTQIRYYCNLKEDELTGGKISEIGLVDAEGDIITIKNFKVKEKDNDFSFMFKINDTM